MRLALLASLSVTLAATAGCPSSGDSNLLDTSTADAQQDVAADTLAADTLAADTLAADTLAADALAADTAAPVTGVIVNEVIAAALAGADDQIELQNLDPAVPVDLAGWSLADDADHTYVFPAGTTIPAGGFLVVPETTFGFGLGREDAVILRNPAGALADAADWDAGDAELGWSFGRLPDGVGPFRTLNTPTPGAPNAVITVPLVVINEVVPNDAAGGDDWVELLNVGGAVIDLSGWTLGDDGGNSYVFPAATTLATGQYLVVPQSTFGFGLGKADSALLVTPNGVVAQSTSWQDGEADKGASWGRFPNAIGTFQTQAAVTPGAPNAD